MGGVPSLPTDRTQRIQVIGAGYSRTGTLSMCMALETLLGGPVMHGGTHLFGREDAHAKMWCEIFDNRNNKPILLKLLREITTGFVGITDSPASMFIPELLEIYPDAKVVLNTRDPERWYKSMEAVTNNALINRTVLQTLLLPIPTWRWIPVWIYQMGDKENERFGKMPVTPNRLIEHNDLVRAAVRPDNLLVMEMKEGWEPLAKFLDKPIPDEPFPRTNDSEAIETYAKRIFVTAGLVWLGILLGTGVIAYGSWVFWKNK